MRNKAALWNKFAGSLALGVTDLVRDILPFGPFRLFLLLPPFRQFSFLPGSNLGARRRSGPGPRDGWTRVRLRLRIALVFHPVFGPFPDDFGSPKWYKIRQKCVSKWVSFSIGFWT